MRNNEGKKLRKRQIRRRLFCLFCSAALLIGACRFCIKNMISIQEILANRESDPGIFSSHLEEAYAHSNILSDQTKLIDVPLICQYPNLPTGCESTAAAMVLQFYGESVSAEQFAGEWLECSDVFYDETYGLLGSNPNNVFVGDPFSYSSYGCYAQPIASAINRNSRLCDAKTLYAQSLDTLCSTYIDQNQPVLIWATMHMEPSSPGDIWRLESGDLFQWIAGEHCMVLTGYNETSYYLADPMTGEVMSYSKELAEMRYEEMGSQAVLIQADI